MNRKEGLSPAGQDRDFWDVIKPNNEEWRPDGDKSPLNHDCEDLAATGIRNHLDNKSYCCTDTDSSETEVSSERTTYVKGKFLGKGGFAQVHELVDLSTRIVYAGKIIPKNRITKPHHIQKIAREISIHRNLIHKNVVRLHHFFEDKVNAYIVLENCSRKSLFHVLKYRYSVTEPEARYYLRQLVEGVSYIHTQKVIHRDLKPGNMLLSEDMTVKLGDFGLATIADGNKKGSLCGTPNYMAPEVLKKLNYSYEADVWAIGCILYVMLVGQPPFETASLKETYTRIVNNKYTIPLQLSESARKLIRQLLNPHPETRILIDKINSHEFFKNGLTPKSLSPLYCFTAPVFNTGNSKRQFACDFDGKEITPKTTPNSSTFIGAPTTVSTLMTTTSTTVTPAAAPAPAAPASVSASAPVSAPGSAGSASTATTATSVTSSADTSSLTPSVSAAPTTIPTEPTGPPELISPQSTVLSPSTGGSTSTTTLPSTTVSSIFSSASCSSCAPNITSVSHCPNLVNSSTKTTSSTHTAPCTHSTSFTLTASGVNNPSSTNTTSPANIATSANSVSPANSVSANAVSPVNIVSDNAVSPVNIVSANAVSPVNIVSANAVSSASIVSTNTVSVANTASPTSTASSINTISSARIASTATLLSHASTLSSPITSSARTTSPTSSKSTVPTMCVLINKNTTNTATVLCSSSNCCSSNNYGSSIVASTTITTTSTTTTTSAPVITSATAPPTITVTGASSTAAAATSPATTNKHATQTTNSSTVKTAVGNLPVQKHCIHKNALLAKITLKQKWSSVLCPDKMGKKKESNPSSMYHVVMSCLKTMPHPSDESQVNPPAIICSPVFVSKWIDYSNKYGFGFQLSNKSVGVLFNDNTRISFSSDKSLVQFHDMNGKITTHPHHSVPEPLHQRLVLLEYFLHYMQENLTDGGCISNPVNDKQKSHIIQMKRWVRTNTAIIMELSNGTLQINFFKDHTKIILSSGKLGYVVTYINSERQSSSHLIQQIARIGSEKNIRNRLKFAAAVLREFAELDGEVV